MDRSSTFEDINVFFLTNSVNLIKIVKKYCYVIKYLSFSYRLKCMLNQSLN